MILNLHFELWDDFYSPSWNDLDFSYILESTLIYRLLSVQGKWMIEWFFAIKKNMHPFESFQGLFVNCTTLDRWDRKIESPSNRNFIKYRNFRNTIFPYLFSYQISYIVKILPITHNTRKKFHVQTISPYHYSGNRGGIKIPPLAYTWLLGRMERVIL